MNLYCLFVMSCRLPNLSNSHVALSILGIRLALIAHYITSSLCNQCSYYRDYWIMHTVYTTSLVNRAWWHTVHCFKFALYTMATNRCFLNNNSQGLGLGGTPTPPPPHYGIFEYFHLFHKRYNMMGNVPKFGVAPKNLGDTYGNRYFTHKLTAAGIHLKLAIWSVRDIS